MANDIIKEVWKNNLIEAREDINKNLSQITDEIFNFFENDYISNSNITLMEIKKQASIFLNELNVIVKATENDFRTLSNLGEYNQSKEEYFARTYRLRLAYLAAFRFAAYVQNYLNQPMAEALVVFEDSNGVPETFQMNLLDLVKGAGSAGHLHEDWLKREGDTFEKNLNNIEHLNLIRKAYELTKWKLSHDKNGKQDLLLIKRYNYSKKWEKVNIVNMGDVKEAYAAALVQEHNQKADRMCKKARNTDDENIVYTFFHDYISKVDSKEALLGEDIILKNIQYAVKGTNAQLPSFNQYVRFAKEIESSTGTKAIKEVFKKEKLQRKGSVRNKVRESSYAAFNKAQNI